jgi:hypothetical protein
MKTSIFAISIMLLLVFSNFSYSQNNTDKYFLVTGTIYTFYLGETYKITGTLISTDSVYYTVISDNGNVKFKKTEVKKIMAGTEEYSGINVNERDTSGIYTLETPDGNSIDGKVVLRDSVSLFFKTLSGIELKIPLSSITSLKPTKGEVVNGKYYRQDPNQSRLFISPTARPLKSGNGYFSNNELFFPMIAFGIGDYVSAAGGMSIFPGSSDQLLYLNLKVTPVQVKNVDIAFGLLYAGLTNGESGMGGIGYLVGTFGSTEAALTSGIGFGFSGEGIGENPVIMLGGELRLSNSMKFISENWIFTGKNDPSLLTFGVRFFGNKLAGDFGLIFPLVKGAFDSGFPAFPFLGFTYNFDL